MKLTKIQKFAKGKACMLRIPGICKTTPNNEDTCLCHAPSPNRGGMRKDDWWGAVGCEACHDLVDGRYFPKDFIVGMYADIWLPAIHEWQEMLIEAGYIKVEGIEIGLKKQLPRRIV